MIWLLLLGILAYFTYFIVQRSVANITRTPVWLLWLVMMMPAFTWTAWMMFNGDSTLLPLLLLIAFIVSSVLYWFLVQLGRSPQPSRSASSSQPPEPITPVVDKPPIVRSINKEEEANLQNCFPWSVFYLQNVEHRPQALICRGQLRTSPEVAYQTIRDNIEAQFSDRFLVVFQEGVNGKPFFALVPNPQAQSTANPAEPETLARPGIALGLLIATLLTTTLAGSLLGNPDSTAALPENWATLSTGLPYAIALLAILGVHELGHYLVARAHRIRATLPYFIPVPPAAIFPFGTFGAFIQLRSPVPNRKALFDVGIAGPLAGFVVTLPILLWGLAHSTLTPLRNESSILNFESFNPTASFLITILSKIALGSVLTADSAIKLHPVAVAGCLGLVVTAFNLMPVGQLDGGHIVHAMFGQRMGAMIGQISRFLVLALVFVQHGLFFWALFLFLMPIVDEPALNDVSELDNRRDFLGLLALGLLVVIVLPAPPPITQFLF